jgi:phosphoglycolate phosphatase-like HAD superfamily hydrolase
MGTEPGECTWLSAHLPRHARREGGPANTLARVAHPVVGFDLDMTLVDSADGILATLEAVGAELGIRLDREAARASIGLPLETVCAGWLVPSLVAAGVRRYRELYPTVGVPGTTLLAGAAEAVEAVRARGGPSLVVSAKVEPAVRGVLEHVGLEVDVVEGGRYGAEKGEVLRRYDAVIYVGDHPGDVRGAHAAGAVAVGVPTGAHSGPQLRAAGADVVLDDLRGFPAWLERQVLDRGADPRPARRIFTTHP